VSRPSHPDVLTPEQLAERLGLSVDDVLAALVARRLPGLHTASGEWRTYWPAVVGSMGPDPAAEVIRVPVLAERLGLTEDTVRGLLAKRVIPGRQLGREWRVWWPHVVDSLQGDVAGSGHVSGVSPKRMKEGDGE
jgi:hypothetical protein